MSPHRVEAYRRVVKTLDDLGPSKLWPAEQDRVRAAADSLIFSAELTEDLAGRQALRDMEQLCGALVRSGRWEPATAARLLEDVVDCGPSSREQLIPDAA